MIIHQYLSDYLDSIVDTQQVILEIEIVEVP